MKRPVLAVGAGLLVTGLVAAPSQAATGTDSTRLRSAVTVNGIFEHLQAFQDAAALSTPSFGYPTRVDGSPGFTASVDYAARVFREAGYDVRVEPFTFDRYVETADVVLQQTAPVATSYLPNVDVITMEYSPAGSVAGAVQAVDLVIPPGATAGTSTSGCEAADFAGFTPGNIALIQRGTCTFRAKVENAAAAGAVGVIIFNEGQPGRQETLNGTLGAPLGPVPAVGIGYELGAALAATAGLRMRIGVSAEVRSTESFNVIADSRTGRSDRTVVVGAHLDSVTEGPGIQDNGSGSAAILELAQQFSALGIAPRNKVRFALWGGEEFGLLGAEAYLAGLSTTQLKGIALNLNFDMIASPNYVRFVYDGNGSATPAAGPNGSGVIEDVFLQYFAAQGLASKPTAFDGRSDYGPFIDRGIPAGGLFTGAEGIKTEAEAAVYGGTAGAAYDHCYHQACDDIGNVNREAMDQMSDAMAHTVLQFAMTTSAVNGTGKAATTKSDLDYKGSRLRK